MRGKPLIVRFTAIALLLLPFAFLAFATGELYFRWKGRELFPGYQACLVFDEKLHHRYLAGCRSEVEGSLGRIDYSFNEHGLRDRPASEFQKEKGLLVALGDSITESIFLPMEESLPRQLEAQLGRKVLNAGTRFVSPTTEALLYLRKIEPNYPVGGVLLLLNASDTTDERLLRAETLELGPEGFPSRFAWMSAQAAGAFRVATLNQWNKGRSRLIDFLLRQQTFRFFREKVAGESPSRDVLCQGLERFARHLKKKKVPLLIAFTPHPVKGIEANWAGEPYRPEELRTLIDCARGTGARVADYSGREAPPGSYLSDDMHFSAAGARWMAGELMPDVKMLFVAGER